MTYAGVPTRSAISATSRPATVSTPSTSLPTPALHRPGSSALTSSGTPSQPGARDPASAWIEPATWVWVMGSRFLGGSGCRRRSPTGCSRMITKHDRTGRTGTFFSGPRPGRASAPRTRRPSRAPVAQGIEHRPPEAVAQVRILPGALAAWTTSPPGRFPDLGFVTSRPGRPPAPGTRDAAPAGGPAGPRGPADAVAARAARLGRERPAAPPAVPPERAARAGHVRGAGPLRRPPQPAEPEALLAD